jgi:GcrA cell cycle regulator
MPWTDANVEQLRQLWHDGRSASQISAVFGQGLTRNAVLGKVHRLKLPKRVEGSNPLTPRLVNAVIAPKGPRARPRVIAPSARHGLAIIAPTPIAPLECLRVTFGDLNSRMCKWPLGDNRYCGNSTALRAPYCVGHARISYRPAPLRSHAGLAALA